MSTMRHFDKLDFVDEAKKTGFTEPQARLIANRLEEVEAYKNEDLATKGDLKDLELRLLKWQIGIAIGIITSLASIIRYFH